MRKLTTFFPPKPIVKPFSDSEGEVHNFDLRRDDVRFIAEMDNGSVIIVQVRDDKRRAILVTPSGGHGRLAEDEIERAMGKERRQ